MISQKLSDWQSCNECLNPTIKSVDIGEFAGDRDKHIHKMLAILEEDYGITEIQDAISYIMILKMGYCN